MLEQELRRFIKDSFLIGQDSESLAGDASFLEHGIIDSTGVLELVNFLEQQYGIKVEDHELVPENLDSIDQLVRFVNAKLSKENAA